MKTKCSNCGKKVKRCDSFCPSCGQAIVIAETVEAKPRRRIQVFKIIMIVLLIMAAVAIGFITYFIKTQDTDSALEAMTSSKDWWVINCFTFFMPIIIVALFKVFGWFICFIASVIGTILSLLTMIRASKVKKIILLVLLIAFITFAIIAFISLKQLEG